MFALRAVALLLVVAMPSLAAPPGDGEEPPPGEVSPAEPGTSTEGAKPDAAGAPQDGGLIPRLDVYFPEGKLDLRLERLVKNAYFEGQIKYNFYDGDITAFLRYRYYSYRTIYQLSVFDAVEFSDVEDFNNDFERVRGVIYLTQWPRDYHRRIFLLSELDRLSSSKDELRFSNNRTNTFVRLGFQQGTPRDTRSNAIVGETRARTESLFTASREIGPWKSGLTLALTYAFDTLGADFDYVKLEAEAVKRVDLTPRIFAVGRVHLGSFPHKAEVRAGPDIGEGDRFSIPRNELFRLDGRENLKGVSGDRRGSEELHSTLEVFVPWFLDRTHHFLWLEWDSFYWILYGGVGTVGFDREVYGELDDYIPDVGIGFEASFRLKGYKFFLTTAVAHALRDSGGIETHLAIRSYH